MGRWFGQVRVELTLTDHLTPELLKAFVQKVVIHPDGSPEIIYKVKNVFYP